MIYLIAFLSLLALIIIHELGHFLVAKKFKVKVEEFGIFLPPKIWGKKVGETIYSINLLPLGAFVKMLGENDKVEDERSFSKKKIWQRALILVAGVASSFIVAIILLTSVFIIGAPQAISDDVVGLADTKVQIGAVSVNSPAENSGIVIGDTIKRIKSEEKEIIVNKLSEVQEFTNENKGKEILLEIERGKEILNISLVPRISSPEGEGAMGVSLIRTALIKSPIWKAPIYGLVATGEITSSIIIGWSDAINGLIEGEQTKVQMIGPIGIGKVVAQRAQMGISYFIHFIAVIAIYLAIFNLLPIPALDGGRLFFLLLEKIKKRPVSQKIEQGFTALFFFILISLMLFITFKDIKELFFK